jgi:GNAT superfamily N-acetyltransferase
MRYEVEQNPRGGWCVRAAGFGRPLSTHDTEDEARAAADELAHNETDPDQVASVLDAAAEKVRLRDGSQVRLRPVVPADRELFVAGFERFGMESRQARFLGLKKQLTAAELDFLTQVDHADHEAIGAIDPKTGAGVGVARMMRDPKCPGECAEAAVAVVDEWQGRGLGGALLARLVARARELGIERFLAVLRTDNRSMLTLFQRTGDVRVRDREGGVTTIEVELPIDGPDGALGAALRSAADGRIQALAESGT